MAVFVAFAQSAVVNDDGGDGERNGESAGNDLGDAGFHFRFVAASVSRINGAFGTCFRGGFVVGFTGCVCIDVVIAFCCAVFIVSDAQWVETV